MKIWIRYKTFIPCQSEMKMFYEDGKNTNLFKK